MYTQPLYIYHVIASLSPKRASQVSCLRTHKTFFQVTMQHVAATIVIITRAVLIVPAHLDVCSVKLQSTTCWRSQTSEKSRCTATP